jgi:hypothetical protein
VKTSSGATAVQIVHSSRRGSRDIEHLGSTHDDGQLELLKAAARQAGPNDDRRDQVIYYQYKADRARWTLRGIDEQVTKAEKAVAGKVPVKRTGSSSCPAARGPSSASWRTKPGHWPG